MVHADNTGFSLRINVGGVQYTDGAGHLWQADKGFNTGRLSGGAGVVISGTDDPELYQSGRWDAGTAPELRYSFDVPDGLYTVRLHFADSWSGTQGEGLRVFDVALEDQLALENLDIFAEVGGSVALVKTLSVQVNDGTLDIEFLHQVQNPEIRAIEIHKIEPVSVQPVEVSGQWQALSYPDRGAVPVLIVGVPSYIGTDPGVVSIKDIDATGASIAFREWDYLDGRHQVEQVSVLSLLPGRHIMSDGSIWEVGRFDLNGTRNWQAQSFTDTFAEPPKLFLSAQTVNNEEVVSVRARQVTNSGFEAALFEQESLNDGHPLESIGYLAIYSGVNSGSVVLQGVDVAYRVFDLQINQNFLSLSTQRLKLEEEQSKDLEVRHTLETVVILELLGHQLFAQDISSRGGDTIAIRQSDPAIITPGDVNISIEAEDYIAISDSDNNGVDDFSRNTRVDASNGIYMQAKGQKNNSYLEYLVSLPVDDVYEISLRGTGTGTADNSFFISVDSEINSKVHLNSDNSWVWKTVADTNSGLGPYSLSAGVHIVRISQRELNAKIDQLRVVNASGPALPEASLSLSRIDFVNQNIGSVSDAQSVTLRNTGSAPLNITGINVADNFSESNDCGDVLAVGSSCQIEINFSPISAGSITGALTVKSDDANSPVRVSLRGSGKAIVSDSVFFNMNLSSYADGTVWTPEIQNDVFGTNVSSFNGSILRYTENAQVQIVRDPYGSNKNVLRIELRPGDFGNIITPHINIYKYGAPANLREATSTLEIALSEDWGDGPQGIHMPFWRSKRFVAQRKPVLDDVYAFFHQYGGNNPSLDRQWRAAGFSANPNSRASIDRMSNFYTYDQARFQRTAYSNFADPTATSTGQLPIVQTAQFKTGGYITQQAHIKLSTPGLNNGFYKGYHDGQLAFDRNNIMTLAAGQTEDLERFAFVFYSNGGAANGDQWNVPDDGKGPKYIYIRSVTLQAGGPDK